MELKSLWIEYRRWIQFLLLFFILVRIFTDINAQYLPFEDALLDIKYRLRGSEPADSSVVVIYLDNEDINSLGGYPVPRLYFATLIHALTDLRVAAIGLDVVFEKPSLLYPEYDSLLVDAVRAAGTVVLGQYAAAGDVEERQGTLWLRRVAPISSFPALREVTNSHGFANISTASTIRMMPFAYPVIAAGDARENRVLPSMIMHLASYLMVQGVLDSTRAGRSPWYGYTSVYPFMQSINFAGGRDAYRSYRLVPFLKSYDSLSRGLPSTLSAASFKGSAVIIAVVAEGRSSTVRTPLDAQFPLSYLHAAALDTILRHKEIVYIHRSLMVGLCALFSLPLLFRRSGSKPPPVMMSLLLAVLFLFLNQASFHLLRLHIPVIPGLLYFALSLAYVMSEQSRIRRSGGDAVKAHLGELQDALSLKSAELEALRRRMSEISQQADAVSDLERKLQSYEEEIVSLRSRIDDGLPDAAAEVPADLPLEFEGMVYTASSPIRNVVEQLRSVAPQEVSVMLYGESGTGKELAARAIHRLSGRRDGPFVAVNCGALSETLLESELFGHEKGAFTGAQRTQQGRFERANGGTLFLDEVGETSEAFQVRLLRVLQEGELERVGGTETIRVDVRIIAATNRDLRGMVARKEFREDLFYRLHVIPITIPPLRGRRMDIPPLVRFFLGRSAPELRVSHRVMSALESFGWPGNVRELESALTRAVILARSAGRTIIQLTDLPHEILVSVRRSADIAGMTFELLRRRGFAHGSINDVAGELGGLDRSTVTEYFRGILFQAYANAGFDAAAAVRGLAGNEPEEVRERLHKKLIEYLQGIEKELDPTRPPEAQVASLHLRYRNLPRKYHDALERIALNMHEG